MSSGEVHWLLSLGPGPSPGLWISISTKASLASLRRRYLNGRVRCLGGSLLFSTVSAILSLYLGLEHTLKDVAAVGARIPQIRKSSNTRRHCAWTHVFSTSQKFPDKMQRAVIRSVHFFHCRKYHLCVIDSRGFSGAYAYRSKRKLVGR